MKNDREAERYRLLTENSSEVVWVYNATREQFVYVSPAIIRQRGLTVDEAMQETLAESMTSESYRLLRERLEAGLNDFREESLEIRQPRKEGSPIWVELTTRYRRNHHGEVEIVGSSREIERQKQIEQELVLARIQAEAAGVARTEFLANMSHEFRTPLSAAIGFLDLALRTGLTPEQENYLRKSRTAATELLRRIDGILDYSRLESGTLRIQTEPFHLSELLAIIRSTLGERAVEKGLDFAIGLEEGLPPVLVGDSRRLEQILSCLVGNAIKFTERGRVAVRVSPVMVRQDRVTVQFTVSDTGIGMDREKESLFKPFVQADSSSTRRYSGAGLGLAIARSLVTVMGGEIHVESEPGKGSTFSFTLEFGVARESGARESGDAVIPDPADQTRSLAGRRVLLAEDSPFNQQITTELLKRMGVTTDVAPNGEAAVKMILARDPCAYDAVLMDVQMPLMDGFEATRAIRKNPGLASLPIIALTARAADEDSETCLAAGMDDYLTKPIDSRTLFATLEKYLAPDRAAENKTVQDGMVDADSLPEAQEGIAVGKALRQLSGRTDLYRQFVRLFLQEYSPFRTNLEASHQLGDRETTRRLVHTLKGAAGAVGAEALQAACRNLEETLAEGDDATVRQQIVLDELDRVLAVLQGFLPPENERDPSPGMVPVPPVPDPSLTGRMLRELQEMLQQGNFAARRKLPLLAAAVPGLEQLQEYRAVEKHLSAFAMERALEALVELAGKLDLPPGE